jgi:hypothetical protein
MVTVVRVLPVLMVLGVLMLTAGSAAAASRQSGVATSVSVPAAASWLPNEHGVRAPEQATDEQSTVEAAAESSDERTAWAVAAIAIFLGITAIGFVLAVYGYSASK